jgi:hypothetical protein
MLVVMSDYSRRSNQTVDQNGLQSSDTGSGFEQPQGNSAAQEAVKVQGALGRAFNRISGVSEGNTDASGLAFSRDHLKDYLKDQLSFANGEMFRGTKISGAADKIMETLDADKDGMVTWKEFQVMVNEMRQHLVGDVGSGASTAEIQEKAQGLFNEISAGESTIGYDALKAETLEQLPAGQAHKGLVAQLAALMVLDIVDLDEQGSTVKDRSIGESEWMSAVNDFTKGG